MWKRLRPVWSILSVLIMTSACGDDKTTDTPPDSGGGDPMCGGHGQPECNFEWLQHNGGEIRLEIVQNPAGKMLVTLYAFFISAQTPEKIPYLTYGKEENGAFGPCSATSTYSNSVNPGQEVNDSRVFVDVGDTITLSDGRVDIVMNRYENIADKRGLIMDIGYAYQGAAQGTVPPDMVLPGVEYTITLSGMGVLPYKLKVPPTWNTVGGNVQFLASGTNNMATAASWVYLYQDEAKFEETALLQFTGNNTAGMKETWFCVGPAAGRIDVPDAKTMFPPSGTMQGATAVHQKVEWNGRLLDIIGVNCKQSAYAIQ
jgi:hypothetical protein